MSMSVIPFSADKMAGLFKHVLLLCLLIGPIVQAMNGPAPSSTEDILRRIESLERSEKQLDDTVQRLDELEKRDKQQQEVIKKLQHENVVITNHMKQLQDLGVQQANRIVELEGKEIGLDEKVNELEKTLADFKINLAASFVSNNVDTVMDGDVKDEPENTMKTGHNGIRQTNQEMPVAFFATLNSHIEHLGQNQPIAFDNVITNVGHAYHNSTGAFVTPFSGIYVFSTTILGYQETKHYHFAVNGVRMSKMYVNAATAGFETTSQTAIFNLKQGDDVTVVNEDVDKKAFGSHFSSFSGFLLSVMLNDAVSQIIG